MRRTVLFALLVYAFTPAQAQWMPWAHDAFGERSRNLERPWAPVEPRRPDPGVSDGGTVRDGGQRPDIQPLAPEVVAFAHDYPASSIVIDTSARKLYYVLGNGNAYVYPISVGREGFTWTGTERISRKQVWPDWHPPEEMRQRDQSLPAKMTGGLRNPLGAVAIYLGDTLYRIHGTNDVKSIGHAQSSGCFRMMNASVVHLAAVAEVGTPVTVVSGLPRGVQVSDVPRAATKPDVTPPSKSQDYRALREDMLRRR
jgi:lipoprotein-anchoring transpeptidase ErfK/SrfK